MAIDLGFDRIVRDLSGARWIVNPLSVFTACSGCAIEKRAGQGIIRQVDEQTAKA